MPKIFTASAAFTPATASSTLSRIVVTGAKDVLEARSYYAEEFLDARRNKPTPYMEKLHFHPDNGRTGDPDRRVVSDEDLEQAARDRKEAG